MKIIVLKKDEDVGAYLGQEIIDLVKANPKAVLGLATGSSPLSTYDYIAKKRGNVSFKEAKSFNLDEYLNCPLEDQTYRYFMHANLFSKIDIQEKNTHFPNVGDPDEYDGEIARAGGVDLQVLGIGRNGHIGFNEPGTPLDSKTHIVNLTESTRDANKRFFHDDINLVPTQAVTMGLGTIHKARKVVLIAMGKAKAEAIAHLKAGKVDLDWPATSLVDHPNFEVVVTEDTIL